ncbi:hypothetical protein [Pelosinus sp. UFO1]|uniref:hypothetical protein n=1 Tax=Pelosinus sp. UFO1 TaxID=484770 RepID=UPI0004D0D5DB|nr:hypothetical protein [Pelosinus sp. UFO1]AIF53529.1 hypothetical protein UFO1_3986 [Pelosinus sp. UFO1]
MEATTITVTSEIRQICTMFHFGWIPKKDVPQLENYSTFCQVQEVFSVIGYEMVITPEWYVLRLKKEYDIDAFDVFHRRNRDFNRNHLAMINILFVKLILPKKMGTADEKEILSISFDEIFLNYGEKFRHKRYDSKTMIGGLLKVLKRYSFIVQPMVGAPVYQAGPSLYMLREDLLDKTYEVILRGKIDDITRAIEAEETNAEDISIGEMEV